MISLLHILLQSHRARFFSEFETLFILLVCNAVHRVEPAGQDSLNLPHLVHSTLVLKRLHPLQREGLNKSKQRASISCFQSEVCMLTY